MHAVANAFTGLPLLTGAEIDTATLVVGETLMVLVLMLQASEEDDNDCVSGGVVRLRRARGM